MKETGRSRDIARRKRANRGGLEACRSDRDIQKAEEDLPPEAKQELKRIANKLRKTRGKASAKLLRPFIIAAMASSMLASTEIAESSAFAVANESYN